MVKEKLEVRAEKTISIGKVIYYSGDLMAFYFDDDITIDVPEVQELFYATQELTGGAIDILSMVVTGERNNISTRAFSYDMYKEMNIRQRTIAEAVVIKDLATRIMANFYYKATRRAFPVKAFSSENDALAWLFGMKYGEN